MIFHWQRSFVLSDNLTFYNPSVTASRATSPYTGEAILNSLPLYNKKENGAIRRFLLQITLLRPRSLQELPHPCSSRKPCIRGMRGWVRRTGGT